MRKKENTEDILLYDAYDKYVEISQICSDKKKNEADLWYKIKNLKNNNFFRYYLFAMHYYKYDYNIKKAFTYINKAIKRSEENIPLFIKISNIDIENFELDFIKAFTSSMYQMAGEIYAIKEDYKKSLEFYKKYHYTQSFIESDFKEKNSIDLYSYRTINKHLLSDLINKTITVCHPSVMNDPYDSPYLLWSSKENLNEICKKKEHIETYSKSFNYFRIRSFSSSRPKNILMWSHYANEHKGLCIKYNLSEHFIKEKRNKLNKHMYLKKVDYNNKKVNIKIPSINTTLGYATKYNIWKYEKEVRLIAFNPNTEEKYDYINLDDKSNIKAIYFGCRCESNDINIVKDICANKYNGIRFYKMGVNNEDLYNMKILKL